MRAVLVHDYLLVARGAERTFCVMADEWPDAPIATLLFDAEALGGRIAPERVRVSPLQRLGLRQRNFRALLPLYPLAASRLPVGGHDVVISSSSAFAHGVRADPDAVHVCYCHTPFRYAWYEQSRALTSVPAAAGPLLRAVLGGVRRWDRAASARVTQYVTNSELSRRRIQEVYGRDSDVIHPPVETDRFAPGVAEDFFLYVGEVVSHKRIDVAIDAAALAGVPLKIAGGGPDLERLRAQHGDRVEFLGRISDAALAALLPRARALVVPNIEEFGITAVEAQASGRPVIALARGGALETIVDGRTGVLVDDPSASAFAEVMRHVDFDRFSQDALVAHARAFSRDRFRSRFRAAVESAVAQHGQGQSSNAARSVPRGVTRAPVGRTFDDASTPEASP